MVKNRNTVKAYINQYLPYIRCTYIIKTRQGQGTGHTRLVSQLTSNRQYLKSRVMFYVMVLVVIHSRCRNSVFSCRLNLWIDVFISIFVVVNM